MIREYDVWYSKHVSAFYNQLLIVISIFEFPKKSKGSWTQAHLYELGSGKDTIAVSKTFACRFRCFEKWQMPSITKCHFVFEWNDSSTSSLVLPLIHVETNLKKRINSEIWHAITLFLRLSPWWGKTTMLWSLWAWQWLCDLKTSVNGLKIAKINHSVGALLILWITLHSSVWASHVSSNFNRHATCCSCPRLLFLKQGKKTFKATGLRFYHCSKGFIQQFIGIKIQDQFLMGVWGLRYR